MIRETIEKKKPVIIVEKLEKFFGSEQSRVKALAGVSFEVFPGEIVFLFGPTGSGKSTLLNILAGLEVPDGGKVVIDGVDINKMNKEEKAIFHREKVGMVFQAYDLIPSLNIFDNISLPLVFSKILPAKRREIVSKMLNDFNLSALADRLPAEVSGGQQQRVGVMRALICQPPIIIADEPTGNLDSASATEVMDLFARLNDDIGTTMIVVTHNPEQLHYADRVIHVLDGKVIKQTVHHHREASRPAKKNSWTTYVEQKHSKREEKIIKLMKIILSKTQLDGFAETEIERTAILIEAAIDKKITISALRKNLDLPTKDGGAGLYSNTAHHIADNIEALLEVL